MTNSAVIPSPTEPADTDAFAGSEPWTAYWSRKELFRRCLELAGRTRGGAAGTDRVSPHSLSPSECGELAEAVSEAVLEGRYRHGRIRIFKRRKPGGGHRDIEIANPADHLVDRHLMRPLRRSVACLPQSELDLLDELDELPAPHERLSDSCYPQPGTDDERGEGTEALLKRLLAWIRQTPGPKWLAAYDIRKAFDNVPVAAAVDALAAMGAFKRAWSGHDEHSIRTLLTEVLTRGTGRPVGLSQGAACSELALNALLHIAHDLPARQVLDAGLVLRYLDNLVYLSTDPAQLSALHSQTLDLLQGININLTLKPDADEYGLFELKPGMRVPLLGLQLLWTNKGLAFRLPKGWKAQVRQRIADGRAAVSPVEHVEGKLVGWLHSKGPALCKPDEVVEWIEQELRRQRLPELADGRLLEQAHHAYSCWSHHLQ